MSRLRRALNNPAIVVLIGRAVAQGGFFIFAIAPSLVLSDAAFNDLVVSVTILFLAVVAPVGAFQQHLLRQPNASTSKRDALLKSLMLAVVCTALGSVVASFFVGWSLSLTLLAAGSLANVVSTLGASFHALDTRFIRSAVLDGLSGISFAVVSVALVVSHAGIFAWSFGYFAVWAVSALFTVVGPTRLLFGERPTALAPLPILLRSGSSLLVIGVLSMAFNRGDYLAMTLVATEAEVSRYALAGRFVGPIMIALGSLNNSLYVRQLAVRDDPPALSRLTSSASRKVGLLALAIVPLVVVAVYALGAVSASFGARHLVPPTLLLALAAVPFAFAIPHAFSLIATDHERVWLVVLAGATLTDVVVVLLIGHRGSTATAAAWLATQTAVWLVLTVLSGRTASLRRSTATAAT